MKADDWWRITEFKSWGTKKGKTQEQNRSRGNNTILHTNKPKEEMRCRWSETEKNRWGKLTDEGGNTGRREMQCRSAGRAHWAKPQVTGLDSKIRFITGEQEQSGRWEDRKTSIKTHRVVLNPQLFSVTNVWNSLRARSLSLTRPHGVLNDC